MVTDYKKDITHNNYKNPDKLKKNYHRVKKQIYNIPKKFSNKRLKTFNQYKLVNENYIASKTGSIVVPVLGSSIFLIFSIIMLFPSDKPYEEEDLVVGIISGIISVFFIIYGFTMPKKEHILNRKDGLITMTGMLWQKNITMQFDNTEFAYSTGGENGVGAFRLEVIRPNKIQTFDPFSFVGSDCYESMSFITWYMDKNRPLPPGEVFDEFRLKDFERRKAAGFPSPLYPSMIDTPEAIPEQQAERERIGGW